MIYRSTLILILTLSGCGYEAHESQVREATQCRGVTAIDAEQDTSRMVYFQPLAVSPKIEVQRMRRAKCRQIPYLLKVAGVFEQQTGPYIEGQDNEAPPQNSRLIIKRAFLEIVDQKLMDDYASRNICQIPYTYDGSGLREITGLTCGFLTIKENDYIYNIEKLEQFGGVYRGRLATN